MYNQLPTNYYPPVIYETGEGTYAVGCQDMINPEKVVYWSKMGEWVDQRKATTYDTEKEALKVIEQLFPAN